MLEGELRNTVAEVGSGSGGGGGDLRGGEEEEACYDMRGKDKGFQCIKFVANCSSFL